MMTKGKFFITLLLLTLLLTLTTSVGVFAAVTTDTVTPSATANYTLYFNKSDGKLYKDEYYSIPYTEQSGKWYSKPYETGSSYHYLVLNGFHFTTTAPVAMVFVGDAYVYLAPDSVNTVTSTYSGSDYSVGIYATNFLVFYKRGDGGGTLRVQAGTSKSPNYSAGIYASSGLTIGGLSHIYTNGGNDADSIGIYTPDIRMSSGEVTATGNFCGIYNNSNLVSIERGTLVFLGDSPDKAIMQTPDNSQQFMYFENYRYTHILFKLTDIARDDWYYKTVMDMVDNDIITGYTNSDGVSCQIRPNNNITRAEFVTILARLFESETDLEQYAGEYFFTDVPDWASKYVGWAAKNGFIDGLDVTHFGSGDNITRQQMAAILYRVVDDMELTSHSSNPAITFTDEGQIDDYALNAVRVMQQDGVINGYSNGDGSFRFQPKGQATRAEAFTMIYNFINAYNPE